jgi:octaprenyl-diphosphate synthase
VAGLPEPVAADLGRVEERLGVEIASSEERLETIARHLVCAGGKRVRPTVMLLTFHAAGGQSAAQRELAIEAAVALELIHSATLLHDDIIDFGETRRGRPSAVHAFGTADTLVAGDFLFCRAFALCARFEPTVVRWAAEACVSLTEGEIMQARFRHNPAVTPADYLQIVERKTASLFAAGARTAAHLAGAAAEVVDAMAACGRCVGLAFQMSDDLLDVIGHPAVTGKPRGIDLRDGNPSLPIVLTLASDPELRRLFANPSPQESEVDTGLARIRRAGVLETVTEHAGREVARALDLLARLPATPHRAALERLAAGLVDRPA